jgi:hypothetical protein
MSNVSKNINPGIEEESIPQVWVFNIGGTPINGPMSGINIPVFVVLGGVLGGYIRYLYKAATKQDVYKAMTHEENAHSNLQ